jgi:hypothetical protein
VQIQPQWQWCTLRALRRARGPERWRFSLDAANALYAQNAQLSVENNPRFYGGGYTLLVILGEYPFIPYFFSNGTYEAGCVLPLFLEDDCD